MRRLVAPVLGLGLALVPCVTQATIMARLSLDELAAQSDLVAIVTVQGARAHWESGHIVTDVTVTIDHALAGSAEANTIVVRTPGGAVGDTGQRVEGSPRLDPNAPQMVFLRREARGIYFVAGMSQGVMPLATATDGSVRVMPSRSEGLAFADRAATTHATTAVVMPVAGMILADFTRVVREHVRAANTR